jgi:cyclophilin family peptidyl-prolyl cis-trans isomerase
MPMHRLRAATVLVATVLATTLVACAQGGDSPLAHPDPKALATPAPDSFDVRFETSRGPFVVRARRPWAPVGVDRFYHLVQLGYYDDNRFFRVIEGFMAQFGIHGNPAVTEAWRGLEIPPDSVRQQNIRGTVTFAMRGTPDTRTTQLFINFGDNSNLDAMGFAPIGAVVEGMGVVDSLYAGYGDGYPDGSGPEQERFMRNGNAYVTASFPKLDYIKTARIVGDAAGRK